MAAAPPLPAAQSVFAPASQGAQLIDGLTLTLLGGAVALFVAVMALMAYGTWRKAAPVDARRWLVGGGLVLPVAVLTVLLAQGLRVGGGLAHDPELKTLEVEVIARRWWWELRYAAPDGSAHVVLANELHLPSDCVVTLLLQTGDVIHSFWVPALAGKVDMIPGRQNRLVVHPTRAGRFGGQCAEYCGTQHANMALEVVVESPQDFRSWLLNQASPAPEPTAAQAVRGRELFLQAGCGSCHGIRGTPAAGTLGPDLTHLATRRLIAAGTLANDATSLVAWLRDAQHLKPGNLMPSTPAAEEDLQAIAAYLRTLR